MLTPIARFAFAVVALNGIGCVGENPPATAQAPPTPQASPLEATYVVEGRSITLHAGRHAEPAAPGSAATVTTTVWGEPIAGDLDEDGRDDAVVILVNESGGSGTFYYLAAAYHAGAQFVGSTALLLGDRIEMPRIAFADGVVTVSYQDHGESGAMTDAPGKPIVRRFTGGQRRLQELPVP